MVDNKAAAVCQMIADQECLNRMGYAALPNLVVAPGQVVSTVAQCLQHKLRVWFSGGA